MSTIRPAQLDPFALYGAGAVAGATTITLQSFQTIDGVNLAMADFGSIGYGTLEPGNGSMEEQISFTGLVQNSNGTCTLSGIKTVLFLTPYTESSGLAKTHAGSTPFVISNTAGFYNSIPFKQNDETIAGQWTFLNTPIVPGTVSDASTTVKGVTKLSTAPVLASNPIAVADTDPRIAPNNYAVSAAGSDTYAITLATAPAAYATGQQYTFKSDVANTGAATLNVNALGAKSIINADGTALVDSIIAAGQVVDVIYDGTSFRLLQPTVFSTDYQAFTASGTWTAPTNLTGNELVVVQAWGAGGGGGAASLNRGPGGGGGAYATLTAKSSFFTSPVTVTVATAAVAGAAGGNTTFGTYLTAYGGGGGGTGGNGFGGGGGAGAFAAGTTSSSAAGGAGGKPVAGAGGVSATSAGGDSTFGGAGGGSDSATNSSNLPGLSVYGGGGGGGAQANGGNSIYGGGGGGSSKSSGGATTGGVSIYGGNGGAGGVAGAASAGVAPGGGGGGAESGQTAGAGARGEVRVWTIRT